MRVNIEADLPTDSKNYEVLTLGVELSKDVEGLTCEIGLRRGGGTKFIIDALQATNQKKTHIAIDPYGNIEYADTDNNVTRFDYTNEMRDDCLTNLYLYCRKLNQNFIFFNLEDTEFFTRFKDGVPIYSQTKSLVNKYSFVHFDGPHAVKPLWEEIHFFDARTDKGAVFVFDDVKQYNHSEVHTALTKMSWECKKTSERKWLYVKK